MTTTTEKPTKPRKVTWVKQLPTATRPGRPAVWPSRVELLQQRPGIWCDALTTFGISPSNAATAKRHGLEATTRMVDGERRMFVRFPEAL